MKDREGGLRASKKERTRSEILENAIALFRASGIRRTRAAEIAAASQVSAATLFNYFPTKSAIAEAWVRGEIEAVLEDALSALGDGALRGALRAVCRRLAEQVTDDAALRREAWCVIGRARPAMTDRSDLLIRALEREQERERVRQDLAATALAGMLRDALEQGLIGVLQSEQSGREAARGLQARVDLIMDGARKRNERVAAPRAQASD